MRVHRKSLLAECGVENDVRCLTTHPGKLLQFLARSRDLASVIVDQRSAERDDVLRFRVEQAYRLDRLAKRFLTEVHHLLRRLDVLEERFGRDVHACVCRLRRKHNGDEQLIRVVGFELGRG
jgi:hypothetical protein